MKEFREFLMSVFFSCLVASLLSLIVPVDQGIYLAWCFVWTHWLAAGFVLFTIGTIMAAIKGGGHLDHWRSE